jgi:UDP-3-O-[3-hydroxymyristoyl] glucosamine N-acyltransferase
MLLNYNPSSAVYLIGSGVVADECLYCLTRENIVNIICLEYNEWDQIPAGSQCILGFQNCFNRKRVLTPERIAKYQWPTYIHPSAVVDDNQSLGKGCWIGSLANISFNATVGDFCVVTSYSNVAHGCKLGQNNFLAPNTIICGSVTTGNNVSIGVGSIIKDQLTLGSDIEFIIASVVTKNILEPGRYYGNRRMP